MPVRVDGNKVIEISTGKVVAVAESHENAQAIARIKNEHWKKKHERKKGKKHK